MIQTKQQYISSINNIFKNGFGCCSDGKVVTNEKRLKNQAFNIYDEVNDEMVKELNLMKDKNIDSEVLALNNDVRDGLIDAVGDVQVFLFGVNHLAGIGDEYKESKHFPTEDVYKKYSSIKSSMRGMNTHNKISLIVELLNKTTDDLMDSIVLGAKIQDISLMIQDVDTVCLVAYETLCANGDIVIKSIAESNFSKVCPNVENLEKSLAHYRDLGIEVHSIEVEYGDESKKYAVISTKNQYDKDDKYYNEDKFLKSIDFVEPITENW